MRSRSRSAVEEPEHGTPADRGEKRPFAVDLVFARLRDAVAPLPKAAMFELAEEGYDAPFEQLIACILSIRTRDEVSLPTARRLFAVARTPAALAELPAEEIDGFIRACTFHEAKARQIQEIARRVRDEHEGALPCEEAVLLSFPGVGPKCAHLALGIACGQEHISVDIHVHRVTNRWGYVREPTPEKTMAALEQRLPRRYWVEINRLLVPFGKHVCTGTLPRCSTCPVLEMCRQVGVMDHR
jgi:endonuclease-3